MDDTEEYLAVNHNAIAIPMIAFLIQLLSKEQA